MAAAALLAACAVPAPIVQQPMSARPQPAAPVPHPGGGIFQAGYSDLPLFEDLRARRVGDTLTIVLNEKTQAVKNRSSSVSKSGAVEFGIPLVQGLPLKSLQGTEVQANSSNTFDGKGSNSADNLLTGTITVTVIEVLGNGNLVVSGEKQMALSQGEEFIRFSGVVFPPTISSANTVSSPQVADARIEYRGRGYIDEAQVMGWLGRFFLTFLPF